MDYLVPSEATAVPLGQAVVTVSTHWEPAVAQGRRQVLSLHPWYGGRKIEHLPPSPTEKKAWIWDSNPGQHQLFGCGSRSRIEQRFGLVSLEGLPTPHAILALETPSQSNAHDHL